VQGAGGEENAAEREVYLTGEREREKEIGSGGRKAARNARTETAAERVLSIVDQLNP